MWEWIKITLDFLLFLHYILSVYIYILLTTLLGLSLWKIIKNMCDDFINLTSWLFVYASLVTLFRLLKSHHIQSVIRHTAVNCKEVRFKKKTFHPFLTFDTHLYFFFLNIKFKKHKKYSKIFIIYFFISCTHS